MICLNVLLPDPASANLKRLRQPKENSSLLSQISTVSSEVKKAKDKSRPCLLYIVVPKKEFGCFVKLGRTGADPLRLLSRYNTAYGRTEFYVAEITKLDGEDYTAYVTRSRLLEAELFEKVSEHKLFSCFDFIRFFIFKVQRR